MSNRKQTIIFGILIIFQHLNSNTALIPNEIVTLNKQIELSNYKNQTLTSDSLLQKNNYDNNNNANDDRDDAADNDKNPREIQKAVCTVTAGEVRASAEAVTTKTLKGVCGSVEMQAAFNALEEKFLKELKEIKNLLLTMTAGHLPKCNCLAEDSTPNNNNNNNLDNEKNNVYTTIKLQPIPELIASTNNRISMIKSAEVSRHSKTMPAPTAAAPILLAHNTIDSARPDKDLKVFTYYWKLENFTQFIEQDRSLSVESPIFSIKGKTLQIKTSFQHMHRDFLYIQLLDASMLTSSRNSIILDTGGLFKQIAGSNKNDDFKYKIAILDQNKQRRSKDLISQEFIGYDKGFQIPNSALVKTSFIKDDSLLIQMFLYL